MSDYPYPGLRPFRRDEADIFFGREEQVDQLLEKLEKSRFLAVVGPSGCGKSSLVQAGLLTALETGFLASAGVRWLTTKMRPGHCPLRNLAEALLELKALGSKRGGLEESVALLLASLRRGPLGLLEVFKETPLSKGANLLIVVDQFEEIFRYRQQYSLDEAEAFAALLLASVQQRDVPIYVVITMRTDFLGDCALFHGLPEAINEGQFLTPRLTREQSRAAITGPAEVFGGRVEPALVNRLLNDMGTDPDQLPLMQHALMRMWTMAQKRAALTLTLDDYEAIGGLEGALSNHADEAFEELEDGQKPVAEVLFRCLSERSAPLRDTRRPTRLSEVTAVAGVSGQEVAEVVEVFRRPDRSFLIPPAGVPLSSETIIDISHESLIRQWKRLNDWVEEEAASAEVYVRLEQTARLWKKERAELWSGLDLENALAWKERQHPSREWARRYGRDFDLAMEFLEESKTQWEKEKKKEEEALWRELKLRHLKLWLTLTLILLIIATALGIWALGEREQAQMEREQARMARDQAQMAEQQRTQTLLESYLTHASLLARIEDYQKARQTLEKCRNLESALKPYPKQQSYFQLVNWFINHISGKASKPPYKGAKVRLYDIDVSPDGHLLAAIGEKGTVVLFETDNESRPFLRLESGYAWDIWGGIEFHPEGKWLIAAGDGHNIVRWALPSGEKLAEEWKSPISIWELSLSPDGKYLAVAGGDHGDVAILDGETGKTLKVLEEHTGDINGLSFSPDGRLLASASADKTAIIWDVTTWKPIHRLKGHTDEVTEVAFRPESESDSDPHWLLATASEDRNIFLWNLGYDQEGESSCLQVGILQGHREEVYGLAFMNQSRYLASASRDRSIRIWDVDLSIELDLSVTVQVLQNHKAFINRLDTFGNQLFSVSDDGNILCWDIPQAGVPKDQRILSFPSGYEPCSCAFAPDGSHIAVGFCNGKLRLYKLPDLYNSSYPDLALLWEKDAHTTGIYRLAFSPDGAILASCPDGLSLLHCPRSSRIEDGTIRLWQVSSGELKQTIKNYQSENHQKGFWGMDFSPDGKFLATACSNGNIGFFEIGQENGRFHPAHEGRVYSIAFCPQGQKLLSVGEDGKALLWDVKTWPPVFQRELKPKQQEWKAENQDTWDTMYWADFSPDDTWIALVGRDAVVHVVNVKSGREELSLSGHEGTIYRAAFNPNGNQVASVSEDGSLRFWNLSPEGGMKEDLFMLRLPTKIRWPIPLWDFAFCCRPLSPSGNEGWMAVPLIRSKRLVLYHLTL